MTEGAFFPGYDPNEEYSDAIEEQAKHKARFCLALGVAPSEYDNLTLVEIRAFEKEYERQNKKRGG